MRISRRGHYRNLGTKTLVEDDLTSPQKRCHRGREGIRWNEKEGVVSFCAVMDDHGEPGATTHEYTVDLEPHEALAVVAEVARALSEDGATTAITAGALANIESVISSFASHEE